MWFLVVDLCTRMSLTAEIQQIIAINFVRVYVNRRLMFIVVNSNTTSVFPWINLTPNHCRPYSLYPWLPEDWSGGFTEPLVPVPPLWLSQRMGMSWG